VQTKRVADSAINRGLRGVIRGLRAGAILAAISLVLNLISRGAVYEHFGIPAFNVIPLYLVGGGTAGLIVALLVPRVRNALTAAAVAATAVFPLILMARVAVIGVTNWRLAELVGAAVIASALGALWSEVVARLSGGTAS